jgi:hypothetical protein
MTTSLDILSNGEISVQGRLVAASNATLFTTITLGERSCNAIYKPFSGERPLWDFPDGTLGLRERAAYVLSELGEFNLVPTTILRDGQAAVLKALGAGTDHLLVFHGGSGSELHEIHETLNYGVVKMNIDTDTQYAYTRPVVDYMLKNYDKVLKIDGEVGSKKHYDPREWSKVAEKGMCERISLACDDLKSSGKSIL